MSFEFQPYDNRGSIAQILGLMMEPARARAAALRQVGDAEARAQEVGGQAWAGAAGSIGSMIAGLPQQIQRSNVAAQESKLREGQIAAAAQESRMREGQITAQGTTQAAADLNLTVAKQTQQFHDDLADILKNTPQVKEGGVSVYNLPAIEQALADRGHGAYLGDTVKELGGLNDAFRNEQAAKVALVQRGAQAVQRAGNSPVLANAFLDQLEANGSYPTEQVGEFRKFLAADPANTAKLTAYLAGPVKLEKFGQGDIGVNPNTGATEVTGPPKPLVVSKGSTVLGPDNQPVFTAPDATKPGTVEDWVARARQMAVTANGGQPLTPAAQQAVDASAMQSFRENNADPEMRAAALAQKNVAAALAQLTLSQAPTAEQARSVAEDLVSHRLAPEQLSSLFSTRGNAGIAFKLAVTAEAKKMDPQFNFEEAASNYNLVKSPAFQSTIRYMDSVQESMPRLQATADKLGNSNVKFVNGLVNATADQLNDPTLKAFRTDVLLVGDEVAKILQGGGSGSATSDAKLRQAGEILGSSDSPAAIKAALGEIHALIGYRRTALTRGTYLEGASAAGAPGVIYARDPQGNLHQAAAGTALPAGWKQEAR